MSDKNTADDAHTRRKVIASVAGLGVLGAGFTAGQASAQTTPDGEIGTSSNPYLRAHINRQVFESRTSDPSSPDNGTMWYRGDL